MTGARFLFPFPNETNVGSQGNVSGAESVERRELRDDCGFVVGGGTREDPVFAVDPAKRRGKRGVAFPLGGRDGLAIVVGVKDNRVLGLRRANLAENDWVHAWHCEEARFDSALLEHGDESIRIALNVLGIGGDVRNGKQFGELVQDLGAVCLLPVASRSCGWVGLGRCELKEDKGRED